MTRQWCWTDLTPEPMLPWKAGSLYPVPVFFGIFCADGALRDFIPIDPVPAFPFLQMASNLIFGYSPYGALNGGVQIPPVVAVCSMPNLVKDWLFTGAFLAASS